MSYPLLVPAQLRPSLALPTGSLRGLGQTHVAPRGPASPFAPPVTRESLGNLFHLDPGQKGRQVPNFRGPSSAGWDVRQIGSKDVGTKDTIQVMGQLAVAGSMHPGIRIAAERITRRFASKDYQQELAAIFEFVRLNVRYQLDPRGYEYVQHPAWCLFVSGVGDCDDTASLLCALALACGHGAMFRTIRADPSRPDEFSHVYALLGYSDRFGQHWYAADVTHPRPEDATFGWEAPEGAKFGTKDWMIAAP